MAKYLCRVRITDIYDMTIDAESEEDARHKAVQRYTNPSFNDLPDDEEGAVDVIVEDPTND